MYVLIYVITNHDDISKMLMVILCFDSLKQGRDKKYDILIDLNEYRKNREMA